MATYHTGNFKHLTLSDRANIEIMIEKGFSFSHKEEINCSQRTLYNYIDQRYFSAINLDLPRKVSYKPRKKQRTETAVPGYRMERTYLDFEHCLADHPDCSVVEMDVVEGAGGKSSPVLLTLFFRSCSFMLLFLMESDSRAAVADVFDFLYTSLGPARYSRLFSVILTDNGASFKDPSVFDDISISWQYCYHNTFIDINIYKHVIIISYIFA